jgi:hypothetical protein
MKNLTRLMKSEGKFYSLLGVRYPRGIPKRVPLYFFGLQILLTALEQVPILPFYWLLKMDFVLGAALNHCVIVTVATWLMVNSNGKKGRSHEAELRAKYKHFKAVNHFALYRSIPKPTTYRFDSELTYREEPRREKK